MNDGKLTQEEINALLADTASLIENSPTKESLEDSKDDEALSPIEIDTLGEIGNISFGSSATTLSTLLGQKVDITTPKVSLVKKTGIKEEFPFEHVSLQVNFVEGFSGENIFLMKASDAAVISNIMLGGEGLDVNEELSEIELSAIQEAMNQMMGASATSMSNIFQKKVDISPPMIEYKDIDRLEEVDQDLDGEVFVKVSFQIKVGELIDSNIMQLMPLEFAKLLVNQLMNPEEEHETAIENSEEEVARNVDIDKPNATVTEEAPVQETNTGEQDATKNIGSNAHAASNVQSATFSEFEPIDISKQSHRNLDLLLDVPLQVTVELGRTKQRVEDVLDLTPGSILELDKLAGEPVDVLVNQKLIAKGEVVVIDENFGVRVTDIISQKDRLMKLK